MGFGFGNDEEDDGKPKELEHKVSDLLKWNWDELEVGLDVQSVLTGTKGTITSIDNHYNLLEIDWENGKQSRASKYELSKVILI